MVMPVLLVAVIGLRLVRWYQRVRAREALVAFALANGWGYRAHDPSLVTRWFLPPFGKGEQREARHVLHGMHSGRPFVAFEYTYVEVTRDSRGRPRRRRRHAAVVAVTMPGWLSTVTVVPETMVDRMLGPLRTDVEFESEDFNRAFAVSGDARTASDLLPPRTMETLVRSSRFAWRAEGDHLVSWQAEPLSPACLLERLSVLDRVLDGAPSFLWVDRGTPGGLPPGPPPVPGSSA
jgi:hypothetical protein